MIQDTILPGYRLNEYMLVLSPHEELWNNIMQLKKEFAQQYEAPEAAYGKPQLMLAKFTQLEMMEERISNRLRAVATALPSFKIELKDFGAFPSHTIMIPADSRRQLQEIVKQVKTVGKLLKTNDHKPQFMDDFYITIARKLVPWQYEKAWLEYSNKQFTGRFMANEMLLLRRREGEKGYKTIDQFQFLNILVAATQGQLF